jgi:monothiol glutaredoxin
MPLNEDTRQRIADLIASDDVVLFMKGNRAFPQCGFSARVVQVLDGLLPEYTTVDVLSDPAIREGVKEYTQWPTIPQLYVRGEFVGGCDIVNELFASGELPATLGVEAPAAAEPPRIEITDPAAERIREHARRAGTDALHLAIDARFRPSMGFGPRNENDVAIESSGVTLYLDPLSATRANGVRIDLVQTPTGTTFKIDNPNAPRG